MRRSLAGWALVLSVACLAPSACRATPPQAARDAAGNRHIAILCYHDISDTPDKTGLTVSPDFLRRQIRDCRTAGWTFVSLDQVLANRDHPERLPQRALVMTFDDGYRSFREAALPILRTERVPATVAVITGFVDAAPAGMAPLMSWDELREVAADSLVTLVSHTHHLHRYETSNPYRDSDPSIGTRRYLLAEARYEGREEYRARVRADLDTSRAVFAERFHTQPRVLVWPYGVHNEMARGLAAQTGFAATLALGGTGVSPKQLREGCLPRIMVNRKYHFDRGDAAWLTPPLPPVRAANVDLDEVYSRDPQVFDARVNQLVARVKALGANTVFLSMCSDSASTGRLEASWCMNHQVHVRADIWSMVAARLSQARIRVWARVPSMNLSWAWQQHPEWRIGAAAPDARDRGDAATLETRWPQRLSPDLPEARRAAIDYLTDLAVYAPLDGLVFDDDASMAPGEPLALASVRGARDKAAAIDDLLGRCRDAVRAWRPDCSFARVVDAGVVMEAGVSEASAQDFARIVLDNDLCVVNIPNEPGSGASRAARSLDRLGKRAVSRWRAAARTPLAAQSLPRPGTVPVLFELRAFDTASSRWLGARTLSDLTAATIRSGIVNVGIGPVAPADAELPTGLLESKATSDLAIDGDH